MTLGDALDSVVGGGTPAREVPDFWGGEIPWAGVKDLRSPRLFTTMERITQAGLESGSTRLISRGTVVVATRMAVGRAVWTEVDTAINQDLKALIAGPALDPRFLFHFMRSNEAWLESKGSGTTVNGIRLETLLRLPLHLPPLAEQYAIASTLDQIDEAIDRSQAVILGVETLHHALLEEVLTHGAMGRHSDWKQTPEIRTLPSCWRVERLGHLLRRIEAGGAPQRENRPARDSEWGVLRVGAVTWGEYQPAENKALVAEGAIDGNLEVRPGDLLLSRANTPEFVGRTVFVRETPPRLLLSDKTLRLIADHGKTTEAFLHIALSSDASRKQLSGAASGSSRSMFNISQESIRRVLIPMPPLDEQRWIVDMADVLRRRKDLEEAALARLRTLRTATSDALLAGKVRTNRSNGAMANA